jgi:hypothetical protein
MDVWKKAYSASTNEYDSGLQVCEDGNITININLAAWVQFNCDKNIVQKKVMIRGAFDK